MRLLPLLLTVCLLSNSLSSPAADPLRYIGKVPVTGDDGSEIKGMIVAGDFCYFTVKNQYGYYDLWRTDGTAQGSVKIPVTNGYVNPSQMVAGEDGYLYYVAKDSSTTSLQATNGTTATLLRTWTVGGAPPPASLCRCGGYIYCVSPAGLSTYQVMVRAANAQVVWSTSGGQTISYFLPVNSTLFAGASNGLYWLDGNVWKRLCDYLPSSLLPFNNSLATLATGVFRLIDPVTGAYGDFPLSAHTMIPFNEKIFLIENGTSNLWKAQSDEGATTVTLFSNMKFVTRRAAGTEALFIIADDGIHGYELWKIDRNDQLLLVKDIVEGSGNGYLRFMAPYKNGAAFLVQSDTQLDLWITDGTEAGTQKIKTVVEEYPSPTTVEMVPYGQGLVMMGKDSRGWEPWISDGTAEGTQRIVNLNKANGPTIQTVYEGIEDELLFGVGAKDKLQLVRTDGTEDGTKLLADAAGPRPPANFFAKEKALRSTSGFYLSHRYSYLSKAGTSGSSSALFYNPASVSAQLLSTWTYILPSPGPAYDTRTMNVIGDAYYTVQSSGTDSVGDVNMFNAPAAKSAVFDLNPSGDSNCAILGRIGNRIYFAGDDGVHGRELWCSNGSQKGTVMVKDLNPGGAGIPGFWYSPISATVGDKIYFAATDGTSGTELWRTNGAAEGTYRMKNLNPGAGSSSPSDFAAVGNRVVFSATTPETGTELFVCDGTSKGTQLLKDIVPGTSSSIPVFWAQHNGIAYYGIPPKVGRSSIALWRTDGTPDGTFLLFDSFGELDVVGTAGNRIWGYNADLKAASSTLFSTDGTTQGTVAYLGRYDFAPGVGVGDDMFYTSAQFGKGNGQDLYRMEGSSPQIRMIPNLPVVDRLLGRVGTEVIFSSIAAEGDIDLWAFDASLKAGARRWGLYE